MSSALPPLAPSPTKQPKLSSSVNNLLLSSAPSTGTLFPSPSATPGAPLSGDFEVVMRFQSSSRAPSVTMSDLGATTVSESTLRLRKPLNHIEDRPPSMIYEGYSTLEEGQLNSHRGKLQSSDDEGDDMAKLETMRAARRIAEERKPKAALLHHKKGAKRQLSSHSIMANLERKMIINELVFANEDKAETTTSAMMQQSGSHSTAGNEAAGRKQANRIAGGLQEIPAFTSNPKQAKKQGVLVKQSAVSAGVVPLTTSVSGMGGERRAPTPITGTIASLLGMKATALPRYHAHAEEFTLCCSRGEGCSKTRSLKQLPDEVTKQKLAAKKKKSPLIKPSWLATTQQIASRSLVDVSTRKAGKFGTLKPGQSITNKKGFSASKTTSSVNHSQPTKLPPIMRGTVDSPASSDNLNGSASEDTSAGFVLAQASAARWLRFRNQQQHQSGTSVSSTSPTPQEAALVHEMPTMATKDVPGVLQPTLRRLQDQRHTVSRVVSAARHEKQRRQQKAHAAVEAKLKPMEEQYTKRLVHRGLLPASTSVSKENSPEPNPVNVHSPADTEGTHESGDSAFGRQGRVILTDPDGFEAIPIFTSGSQSHHKIRTESMATNDGVGLDLPPSSRSSSTSSVSATDEDDTRGVASPIIGSDAFLPSPATLSQTQAHGGSNPDSNANSLPLGQATLNEAQWEVIALNVGGRRGSMDNPDRDASSESEDECDGWDAEELAFEQQLLAEWSVNRAIQSALLGDTK